MTSGKRELLLAWRRDGPAAGASRNVSSDDEKQKKLFPSPVVG